MYGQRSNYQNKYYGNYKPQMNSSNFSNINNRDNYQNKYYGNMYGSQISQSNMTPNCQTEKDNLLRYIQTIKNNHKSEILQLSAKCDTYIATNNRYYNYNIIYMVIIIILSIIMYYMYKKDNYINIKKIMNS
jgi:hypothetical protein